jgi:hypothetical protein
VTKDDQYRVVGYHRTDILNGPQFIIPLFQKSPIGNEIYIQEPDPIGKICSFICFEGATFESAKGPIAQIGADILYGFIDEFTQIHFGNINELKDTLFVFAKANKTQFGVNSQIAELIGDRQQKVKARVDIIVWLRNNNIVDDILNIFFLQTIARPALWEKLQGAVKGKVIIRNFAERRRINVVFQGKNKAIGITVPVDIIIRLGVRLFNEIVAEFTLEMRETARLARLVDLRGFSLINSSTQDRRLRRQEARVARLLKEYVDDLTNGLASFERYQQNERLTKFERYALGLIGEVISPNLLPRETNRANIREREYAIARVLDNLYKVAYPLNRGILLVNLADQLYPFPVLNRAIRSRVNSSSSMAVSQVRDLVYNLLDQDAPR